MASDILKGSRDKTTNVANESGRMTDLCEQKAILLDAYDQATLRHSHALQRLRSVMGKVSKATYQALYRDAEILRKEAQVAQAELETHVTAHQC